MTTQPPERDGVLVIRAWIESNGEERLRARITRAVNLERADQVSSVAATPKEITDAVSAWLDELLDARPR